MRAIQLEQFGLHNLAEVDLAVPPRLGPHEVRVRFEAASLNYRDLLAVSGNFYLPLSLPLIPIADGAGSVLETGAEVTRFKPGDRVTTLFKSLWKGGAARPEWGERQPGGPDPGVMRDEAVLDEYALVRAPAAYSAVQAATLPIAALTAWHALEQARLTTGQTLLTLGTGGVSLFALQFAKARGATVIVTSSSEDKLARAKALGADVGINYRRDTNWGRSVFEETQGGADVVLEMGGADSLPQSMEAVRQHGTVALAGFVTGFEAKLPLAHALLKRVRLLGISVAPLEQHERMVKALEAARIEPVIDRVFGFRELRAAFEYLQSGRHFGKIAIDFSR